MSGDSTKHSGTLPAIELAGAIPLEVWRKSYGLSRTSAFLWRRSGKLKVVSRYGHAYVTAEESRRQFTEAGAKQEHSARKQENSGSECAGSVCSISGGRAGAAARCRRR